ncbi:expressed protein [Batrachochytrium dendrobatidis JAM81]|uniref:Expressed protein n=1 Tax=Batrachochytrium dendrobatidis (strain JAM81 / FGSC 10211) TaxID=684364 RepID=F4NTR4_BATDJ|nr:uncharacterized protein BATDEDRAFT_36399 [Batrachochytrium dendrobatidis JAM81]EGF83943.1 expressed protein [Batrachochytrium dendrobatidis JAM81]KAJ8331295.1 hypothetical protein O5D80_000229 [Batrachochytrium dendrobatidis]KAK5671746.1 hypothetical protein QVD99_001581 [Batrachochytrium dendrobatidis]|eukprot:XP_006675849.1 expressed protein [Batrachochytrium dendrobatidis JAM81]
MAILPSNSTSSPLSSRRLSTSFMNALNHGIRSSSSDSTAVNSPANSPPSRRSTRLLQNSSLAGLTSLKRSFSLKTGHEPSRSQSTDTIDGSNNIGSKSFNFNHSTRLVLRSNKRVGAVTDALKHTSFLASLPNELLLVAFEFCSTASLLNARLSTSRFCALANVVLSHRFKNPVMLLALTSDTLASTHRSLLAIKRPQIIHYNQFLASSSTTEITEVAWYASPPAELQTVCECLCILRGVVPPPADNEIAFGPGRVRAPWSVLRRIMSRYDFKTWLVNLKDNYTSISITDIRRVEDIIRMDALITYERLREVSMAGYRLLIIVAAVLQSGIINGEIEASQKELQIFERKYELTRKFLAAVNGKHLLPTLPSGNYTSKKIQLA